MLPDIKRKELIKIFLLSLLVLLININPLIVNAAVYNVSSNFEQFRVNYITQTYLQDTSEHFIYKYTQNDSEVVEIVKYEAERSYQELSRIFNITTEEKITIIIFPDVRTMNITLKLESHQKSIGLYYCGFISVLSPNAWVSKNSNIEKVFMNSGPIAHELTHYFVDKRSNGNYPIWFTEGVALYFEKQLTGFEWGTDIKGKTNQYTIKELTENFGGLDTNHAYRRSYDIIDDFVNRNSEEKLLNIIDRLGEGYKLEEFGMTQ